MGKVAFVFSGQGAQHPGMGRSLYENYPSVKKLFDEAESVRSGTLGMCFDSTDEELKKTDNTQPCLYLCDLAAALALKEEGVCADACAGFSLGELSALAYAGAYPYLDGFRISCYRGAEMAKAPAASMLAVLKLSDEEVCNSLKDINGAWAVNFNSPGQVVVSCLDSALSAVAAKLKEAGGRVMPLKVGGGFHSPLMEDASEKFAEYIKKFNITKPVLPVYADRTAEIYSASPTNELPLQMKSPVKWRLLIEKMYTDGFDTFIECGVGNTLVGLIRRILPDAAVYSATDTEEIKNAARNLLS